MICSSCDAPIIWTVTKTGAKMPLDSPAVEYEGDARGLFAVLMGHGDRIALAFSDLPEDVRPKVVAWRSHFATCPNAGRHRR